MSSCTLNHSNKRFEAHEAVEFFHKFAAIKGRQTRLHLIKGIEQIIK